MPDGNGGVTTVTKSGVLLQMNNGDIFIRPRAYIADQWTDISAVASVTLTSVGLIDSAAFVCSRTEFNADIYDIPLVCVGTGTLILTDRGEVPVED
ncbi:hypothetical protein [Paracoccus tegillarcae]|uniref:hypothetical protein n=1 Tax=Paracoccus tegillarcae TaxID=1529068 RepID=UPI0013006F30|nr:hypothetical protein [Paracoccus tegillarcae]